MDTGLRLGFACLALVMGLSAAVHAGPVADRAPGGERLGGPPSPGVAPASMHPDTVETRLAVGTESLVSRDHPAAHVELMAAADPAEPGNLLVGAITMTGPDGGPATRTYATVDGGRSWQVSVFPEQSRWGGADPQVSFTPAGTALFATLTTAPDEEGRTRGFLHTYRSEDGGLTWSPVIDLGASYDHPQMVVDHGDGPWAGRAWIAVLHGFPVYTVSVFRSDDDGKSWVGPLEAANGGGEVGINATTPLVLSDGTLVVPYLEFDFRPERREEDRPGSLRLVTSSDGGRTFSEPSLVATRRFNDERRLGGFPQLAVGRGEHVDVLHAVWVDHSGEEPYIAYTRSTDRGRSWSEPVPVDARRPPGAVQFQPAVAVNADGVVGVSWFDTRGQDPDAYHQFFTASTDGGRSWLDPVRVSTLPSSMEAPQNWGFTPRSLRGPAGELRIAFLAPAARWGTGGDYMGLAAGPDGRFHPFWTDTRYGAFQIVTAPVELRSPPSAPRPVATRMVDLTDEVDLEFDPSDYDARSSELTLRVRIRNVGTREVRDELVLEVRDFGSGQGTELREYSPVLLDADNGRPGVGGVIDLSDALDSTGRLRPGEVTGPVEIRLRLVDPRRTPDMHLVVRGRVAH